MREGVRACVRACVRVRSRRQMVRANGGVATAEMLAPYLEPERDFDAADADAAAVAHLTIICIIYIIYIIYTQ